MEVMVKCIECGHIVEEYKIEIEREYKTDAIIYVVPCDCVKEEE